MNEQISSCDLIILARINSLKVVFLELMVEVVKKERFNENFLIKKALLLKLL